MREDGVEVAVAVFVGNQRALWFVTKRGKVRVTGGDVGRVAEDEVGALFREGCEPVGLDEGEVGQPMRARVFCGNGECVGALVGGGHVRVRTGGSDGERQCAAAGAEVDDGRRAQLVQVVQGAFDEDFAVAARDEGGAADFEVKAVEGLVAEEVGERFARVQAGGEGVQRLLLRGAEFGVVDALCGGREAGNVRGEVTGFEGGNFRVGMGGDGAGEPVVQFHACFFYTYTTSAQLYVNVLRDSYTYG